MFLLNLKSVVFSSCAGFIKISLHWVSAEMHFLRGQCESAALLCTPLCILKFLGNSYLDLLSSLSFICEDTKTLWTWHIFLLRIMDNCNEQYITLRFLKNETLHSIVSDMFITRMLLERHKTLKVAYFCVADFNSYKRNQSNDTTVQGYIKVKW